MAMANVCLRSHWKKRKSLDDRSFACQYVEPLGFFEMCESIYEFQGTIEEARKILLEAGMTEDPAFTAFMERCR